MTAFDRLDFRTLVWKLTSHSYIISSFWICSINADKCLRTYYKVRWKYVNTAEINSNKDFDFVGWVIKTNCTSILFSQCKVSLCEKKHIILIAFWRWWKFLQHLSTKHKETNVCQDLLTIWKHRLSPTWKCTRCAPTRCTMQMYASYLLQTRQTRRSKIVSRATGRYVATSLDQLLVCPRSSFVGVA